LELEPDGAAIGEREVERDEAAERAVGLEQERWTDGLPLGERAQGQVGDVGRRVICEAHGPSGDCPRHGGMIGLEAHGEPVCVGVTSQR
jgi:hypothetical protein